MTLRSGVEALRRGLKLAAADLADELPTAIASDFLHGGAPDFARAFDRRGMWIGAFHRRQDEPWTAFRDRAVIEARALPEVAVALLGGLPDGGEIGLDHHEIEPVPRGAIVTPEKALHPSQVEALRLIRAHRRVALVCGRRWGKSSLLVALAVDAALSGRRVGLFAPTRTLMSPLMRDIVLALRAVRGTSINTVLGEIRLANGGHIDFWSVDHTGRAGRGRKYHLVLIDEGAHDEGYLNHAFPAAIAPALIDYAGAIVLASTPNGVDPLNFFWQAAHLPELGFEVHHAPTAANPHLPADEIVALRKTMRPEVASQELDALFVSLEGMSIFPLAAFLSDGEPVPDDEAIDTLGVTIDSAAGHDAPGHDGTAAIVWGFRHPRVINGAFSGGEVIILDWDIRELPMGDAASWLKHVNSMYRAWAVKARPRLGLDGFNIEKPAMGLRLLEVAEVERIPAKPIHADWVSLGKDDRALMVEPHVTNGRVKIARSAYDKRMMFHGALFNHLLSQTTGFRIFDKQAGKRADDLVDCLIYATIRCLGDGRAGRWDKLKRAA